MCNCINDALHHFRSLEKGHFEEKGTLRRVKAAQLLLFDVICRMLISLNHHLMFWYPRAGANIFDVLYLLWLWLVSKSRWQIENLVVMVNQLVLIHLRQHCLHHRPCQPGNWLEGFYHHIPHHATYLHNPRQALWTSWSVWPPTTPSSSCWPSSCMPFLNTADTMRWLVYINKKSCSNWKESFFLRTALQWIKPILVVPRFWRLLLLHYIP